MRNVHYISQTGTSGYANASKGYVYDLIKRGINVKWTTFLCDQSLIVETTEFDSYINKYRDNNIPENEIDTVIIHSTPDIWQKIIEDLNIQCEGKTVIGRTVWEFNKLIPEWVDFINTSQVTQVSVPTLWNKEVFEESGVNKSITIDPHLYVDYPYKSYSLKYLLENKSTVIYNKNLENFNFETSYKFYTIGQLISRKGIKETISTFCKSFTNEDNVVLFVKTFGLDYSYEQQVKCLEEIINSIRNSLNIDHPPIVFVKENLTYDELQSLHDICNCYVQLTKTEGFGLGIFEAFNKKNEILVTGYGGQVEFLGKTYKGLINYNLKPLTVNESVFFQFKLDDTYQWAIADENHSTFLLKKLIKKDYKELINFGEGFHGLEIDGGKSFKWMSDLNEIYINEDVDVLILEIVNVIESNIFNIIDDKGKTSTLSLIKGSQTIKIPVKNVNKIIINSKFFIPSISINLSTDDRKLSCRLYDLKLVHNKREINVPVDKINYTNQDIKKLNDSGKSITEYVGDYGEMSVRIKDINLLGKINLGVQTSFYSHRSGWDYVIHNMSEFNNPKGVYFDGFIENAFSWRKNQYIKDKIIPYKTPWIGFLHNPPNMPLWFSDNNSYPQTLLNDEYFKESLNSCKGLYVLSNYYKKFLKYYLPQVPINVLYHPTELPELKFSFDKFYKNKNKSIVNIGWWLRRLNSIFLLNSGIYKKIRLMPNNKCKDTILRLTNIERDLYNIILTKKQIESVKIVDHLKNDEYDQLLSQNIVFLDLYDTSANNAVIECIARGTPLLINRHPATIEYLGDEYPFYFDTLEEASEKSKDYALIQETHKYLMTFDKRKQITIEYFKQQFKESEIYKSL